MSPPPTPSRTVVALVSAAETALYYALPDLVPSRTARGWAKAGLATAAVASTLPQLRAGWATVRQEQDGGDLASAWRSLPARSRAAAVGVAAAVLVAGVAGVVTAERALYRRGQARAAAGKRLPHTGPALVYGAVAGALWLLPDPPPPAGGAAGGGAVAG